MRETKQQKTVSHSMICMADAVPCSERRSCAPLLIAHLDQLAGHGSTIDATGRLSQERLERAGEGCTGW